MSCVGLDCGDVERFIVGGWISREVDLNLFIRRFEEVISCRPAKRVCCPSSFHDGSIKIFAGMASNQYLPSVDGGLADGIYFRGKQT